VQVVDDPGLLRIGELSRRVGVSEHVLRAWERRYALLRPTRSSGGYRLYSPDDLHVVQRMIALIRQGLSPAEAAPVGRTAAAAPAPSGADLDARRSALADALDVLDDAAAEALLDDLSARVSVESALRDVVLPIMREVGTRWERGRATIAQEHFATAVMRSRITAFARGWSRAAGPRALLACPSDERHDLALLAFGVALNRRGWSITYLGADTPVESVTGSAEQLVPDAVVLAAIDPQRFTSVRKELRALGRRTRLCLAGPGATPALARSVGAEVLTGDPVSAAQQL